MENEYQGLSLSLSLLLTGCIFKTSCLCFKHFASVWFVDCILSNILQLSQDVDILDVSLFPLIRITNWQPAHD